MYPHPLVLFKNIFFRSTFQAVENAPKNHVLQLNDIMQRPLSALRVKYQPAGHFSINRDKAHAHWLDEMPEAVHVRLQFNGIWQPLCTQTH